MDEQAIVERVNERAAIMQFDGGLNPDVAFKMAFFEIKRVNKLVRMPESLCEELKAVMVRLLK